MRRKKVQETTDDPAKFWPIPGVDDEPYPPRVQEALDLVEKETRRRKIQECKHEGRFPSQVHPGWEGLHSRPYHVCACRDCGAERIACVPSGECDYSRKRTPAYGFSYEQIPPMVTVKEAGRQAGMFEQSLVRALQREMADLEDEMEEWEYYDEGAMRRNIESVRSLRDWERIRQRNQARQELRKNSPYVVSKREDMSWIHNAKLRIRLVLATVRPQPRRPGPTVHRLPHPAAELVARRRLCGRPNPRLRMHMREGSHQCPAGHLSG